MNDETAKAIIEDLCSMDCSQYKFTDRQLDMIDAADRHLRSGGVLSKSDKESLKTFYEKIPSRKVAI